MSYSWAGMSNNMFPNSSSKQKKKSTHSGNYAGLHYLPFEEQIQCLHNQAPHAEQFFIFRRGQQQKRRLPGGFFKDETKVGPKNVKIKLLNFTPANRKVNQFFFLNFFFIFSPSPCTVASKLCSRSFPMWKYSIQQHRESCLISFLQNGCDLPSAGCIDSMPAHNSC